MTSNQSRQKTEQVQQQPRPGVEDQRRTNPARQATRTEPSHQKDVHDQRMLDREEGDADGSASKHSSR